jgi:hypothetical protein
MIGGQDFQRIKYFGEPRYSLTEGGVGIVTGSWPAVHHARLEGPRLNLRSRSSPCIFGAHLRAADYLRRLSGGARQERKEVERARARE